MTAWNEDKTWIEDEDGNRCSALYFGSAEAAEQALASLKNCKNCVNCSDCSRCSGCSLCSDCSDCSDCSGCSDCSRCSDCSDCSDCSVCSDCSLCSDCSDCSGCSLCSVCSDCSLCSDCSDCSRCSVCSRCSGCSGCSLCSDCSRCSGCSLCSDCSDCSRCSDCSGCSVCSDCSDRAFLYDKRNVHPAEATAEDGAAPDLTDPYTGLPLGVPPVPAIPEIHKRVFDAVSQPKALDMSSWHTCETTHCRAGWVVQLAGEEGRNLESFFNTGLAARLIYRASGYEINPARFYDSNDVAMADMKRLAEG